MIMVGGIPNISIPTLSFLKASSGRTSLPVDPSALIYSHFKNVSGIPAAEGTQGVSISKLNLLDVLIDQFNQVKSAPAVQVNQFEGPDAVIQNFLKQISEMKAAQKAMPYNSSPSAPSSALFSLTI
jgi:hypothetical protein